MGPGTPDRTSQASPTHCGRGPRAHKQDRLTAGASAETVRAIAFRFQPVHAYRLKHSFAVRLLMSCDNAELVQKALGHTSGKTTSIYTTMAVDPRLAGAIKKALGA